MDQHCVERIEKSFNRLSPRAADVVDRFYARLFAQHGELRHLFPKEMTDQKNKLLTGLALAIQNLRHPDQLRDRFRELGRRHADYGVKPEHYPIIRDTLVSVIAEMSGDAWDDQYQTDWESAIDFVSCAMMQGAKSFVVSGR